MIALLILVASRIKCVYIFLEKKETWRKEKKGFPATSFGPNRRMFIARLRN